MDEKRQNREIKFRAWNAKEQLMSDPFGLIRGTLIWRKKGETAVTFASLFPEYIVMQWTGLKDKHGKDIYEGDILKFFDKVVATVVWKDFGGWSFNWIDPRYKVIRQQNPEPFFHNINLFEIVGNIYTSPELSEY